MTGAELAEQILASRSAEEQATFRSLMAMMPPALLDSMLGDLASAAELWNSGDRAGAEDIAARYGVAPGVLAAVTAQLAE